MAEKFNPNSFGTFLETMQGAKPTRGASMLDLLRWLGEAPAHTLTVATLLAKSDLPVETFSHVLGQMEAAGFVTKATVGAQEQVTATEQGLKIFQLQH